MKIVRIIARLNVGGPARHVVWLTQALRDDEFETTLIAGSVPPGEDDMSYFADEADVRPVYLREMSRELSLGDLISTFKLYRMLVAEKPDVVHTHTAKAGSVGRTAAFLYRWLTWKTPIGKPRRVKVIHTFHGHIFHSYYGRFKTNTFLAIERLLARIATNKIIVLSEQQLSEINSEFRVGRRAQFQIIPLGVDTGPLLPSEAARKEVRREIGAADKDVIVGFVGRLTEIKNLSLLLEVAARFRDDEHVKFVIVGDGNLRNDLEQQAKTLDLMSRLAFLGNRTDIARVYNGLDIVALTSLNEGTPLSLIEAMAAGKPVISTAVGGVPGLLGDVREICNGFAVCERGIRVEGFAPEDYARGLSYLIESRRARVEMASQGSDLIRAKYGKERLIADIKDLYRELMNGS
ncbi:MAG TPA: glycosyltransferase [Pyrinomonadaceae bacterium]|jgi:glycosyltransferase involved in cell wall biosynthesis